MNSPSPLVPQGAIAPKNTSRSARVILIAFSVVALHVAGLGVVLMQGCQKDAKTAGTTGETNTPPLTLPTLDNTSPYYSSSSNLPPSVTANAVSNAAPAPLPVITSAPPTVAVSTPIHEPPNSIPAPVEAEGSMKEHKVVARDTLSSIAAKNKITLGTLLKANPDLDPKKLKIGQTIKIPAPATAAAPTVATATAAGASPTVSAAGGSYKVKPGDTLTKIAKAHGITVNQLRAANNMRTTQLLAGRVLKIPARTTAAAPATTNTTQH